MASPLNPEPKREASSAADAQERLITSSSSNIATSEASLSSPNAVLRNQRDNRDQDGVLKNRESEGAAKVGAQHAGGIVDAEPLQPHLDCADEIHNSSSNIGDIRKWVYHHGDTLKEHECFVQRLDDEISLIEQGIVSGANFRVHVVVDFREFLFQ